MFFDGIIMAIEERKQEREDKVFRTGFEWAIGEHLVGKSSLEEIEAMTDADDQGPFEDGVEEALAFIRLFYDLSDSQVGVENVVKNSILYRMARLLRNTDGLHPSTAGPMAGQLLGELRRLDCARYDREVM